MRWMRHFAVLLSAVLACFSAPPQAWAQFARTAAPVRVPVVPTTPAALALPKLSSPGLSPTLSLSPLPSAAALPTLTIPTVNPSAPLSSPLGVRVAPAVAPVASVAEPLPKRLERLTEGAAADLKVLPASGASESRGTAETGFNRLLGAPSARPISAPSVDASAPAPRALFRGGLKAASANAATEPSTPAAPVPAVSKGDVRSYLVATSVFKVGIEALGLAVPLIALTVFGQAAWAAGMAMGWGLAQIIGSSIGGGILDRKPPAQVLSRTMLLQAITVGTLLALFAAQTMTGIAFAQPLAVLGLHIVTGILAGVADTARQVIPPAIVGADGQDLKVFNAKVHIAYQVAGVAGAIAAGVIIAKFGVIAALLLHPPSFLLAAWLFSRLKLAPAMKAAAPANSLPALEKAKQGLVRAWSDFKAGLAAVKSSKVVFWASVALVIPLLLHRLLEGLLIPIAAKTILADPSVAAWIIAASNFGELLGAFWLMRANRDESKPTKLRSPFWVKMMSLGILALWTLTLAPSLWFILPAVAFGSLTWAASDLSLRSKIQESLPPELRGRTFGFLTAATFALVLLSSATLGFVFDAVAAGPAFWAINAALTAVVAGLFFAASRLSKTYPQKDPTKPEPSR